MVARHQITDEFSKGAWLAFNVNVFIFLLVVLLVIFVCLFSRETDTFIHSKSPADVITSQE